MQLGREVVTRRANAALSDLSEATAHETERDELENDLRWAAQRQLGNFYRQACDADERKYPTLARIVREVVGEQAWYGYPTTSLIAVMRIAIARLPAELNGRRPEEPSHVTRPRPWRGAPERQLAEILYGYRQDLVSERPHRENEYLPLTYDDYLSAAFRLADLVKLDKRDRGRVTQVIRQDLTDELLALEREALRAGAPISVGAPGIGIAAPAGMVAVQNDRPTEVAAWQAHVKATIRRLLSEMPDALILDGPEDQAAIAELVPAAAHSGAVLVTVVVASDPSGQSPAQGPCLPAS
jgi:hypothetical protein